MTESNNNTIKFFDLNVVECGQEQCIPNKGLQPFAKKGVYTIHYIQSGKGFVTVNGSTRELGSGDLFVMFPGEVMSYYAGVQKPWSYNWVLLDGTMVDHLIALSGITRQNPFFSYGKDNEIGKLYADMYTLYRHHPYTLFEYHGVMYTIFGKMIHSSNVAKKVQFDEMEDLVKDTAIFIDNNYNYGITVKDMADNVCVSAKYLWYAFSNVYKMSPKQYLTKVRMERAKDLIEQGKAKIKNIAIAVGYVDQLHFSREFKKAFGMSPRRMYKELDEEERASEGD